MADCKWDNDEAPRRRTIREIARAKGRARALQIFTAWAFAGDQRGYLVPASFSNDSVGGGMDGDEDLAALAQSALLWFGRLESAKRQSAASAALRSRHRDGHEPKAGSEVWLDCERVYRLVVRLEKKGSPE